MRLIPRILTVNYSPRRRGSSISAIILHDTGASTAESTLTWFQNPQAKVSSHYLVDLDGTVYHLVPDDQKAWHAGRSALHGEEDVNEYSLGIEMVDADDHTAYPMAQVSAVVELCTSLCRTYAIPLNRVVGHEAVALPLGRKGDPGPDWPWYAFLVRVGTQLAGVV